MKKKIYEIIVTTNKRTLPVFAIVLISLLVSGLVAAGFLIPIQQKLTKYNVVAAATLVTNMPDSVNASGGDVYEWNWSITMNSNRQQNLTYVFKINTTSTTLSDGEVKLVIKDDSGTVLAENTTVGPDGFITATVKDVLYNPGETKNGTVALQFNLTAEADTYNNYFEVYGGTFNYQI